MKKDYFLGKDLASFFLSIMRWSVQPPCRRRQLRCRSSLLHTFSLFPLCSASSARKVPLLLMLGLLATPPLAPPPHRQQAAASSQTVASNDWRREKP